MRKNLLSKHQSGFHPDDSCTDQLLAITNDIFLCFDSGPSLETHRVFLDISKAFSCVWNGSLFFKIKTEWC